VLDGRLLVVAPDGSVREQVADVLRAHSFRVHTAPDVVEALDRSHQQFHAVVLAPLDRHPTSGPWDLPTLLLTDREAQLLSHRDPVAAGDLIAQVTTLLVRRTAALGVLVDPLTHELSASGGSVALSPTEFRLLTALLEAAGVVQRRRHLVSQAWPGDSAVLPNTLDQYVARLRRKLAAVAAPGRIVTSHGIGYRFDADRA
jgi:two-component system response regulator MprA